MPAIAQSIARTESEQRSKNFSRYKELLAKQESLKEAEVREVIHLAASLGRNATADAAVMQQAAHLRSSIEANAGCGKDVVKARQDLVESHARLKVAYDKANAEHKVFVVAELEATAAARAQREAHDRHDQFLKDHADLLGE
jgi:hypothetical protein